MMQPIAADAQLFIIFNVSYNRGDNKDDGTFVENPFKKYQLEALFQLTKKVTQQVKTFDIDVKNEETVNEVFDHIANHIRREKARKRKANIGGAAGGAAQ